MPLHVGGRMRAAAARGHVEFTALRTRLLEELGAAGE
jgi:hypothetical protein